MAKIRASPFFKITFFIAPAKVDILLRQMLIGRQSRILQPQVQQLRQSMMQKEPQRSALALLSYQSLSPIKVRQ